MDTLLTDLFQAYYDARRNKRNTPCQLRFELDLETNLIKLYQELRDRCYCPSPSVYFIVQDSVRREVFASDFRDRVVHHLYYNYVASFFDRQFVYDSYSCRKGKGTLLGIKRMERHIRSVSHNYSRDAYVLKMDVKGYFMSINRSHLCAMVHEMTEHVNLQSQVKDLVDYLTDIITLKDPLKGARRKGNPCEWADLPPSKCLSFSPSGIGLPIGDLTSQLYSNIFLNKLDWYVNQMLGFKHYGRYVDDFYIVDTNKKRLADAVPQIASVLASIGLSLHPNKTRIIPVTESINFLGAEVRPYYRHCSARTMRKFEKCLRAYKCLCEFIEEGEKDKFIEFCDMHQIQSSINSYLGYMRHFKAATISCDMLRNTY